MPYMHKMNLCIDIGNTLLKAALFDHDKLVQKEVFSNEKELFNWTARHNLQHIIVGSVKEFEKELFDAIPKSGALFVFDSLLRLPIQNKYASPETLGQDRLASVIGAQAHLPKQDCLVIDAGTCVTYDFITSDAEYMGGAISPGLHMRFKALHHFTAKLPLVESEGKDILVGSDTYSCIRSGVVNGLTFEIEKTMSEYRRVYPALQVLMCGGDAPFFESRIKETIFVVPDLVLFGLNHTLLYNAPR